MNDYHANPAVEFDWPGAEESDSPLVARVHGDPPATVPVDDLAVVETFADALGGRTGEELASRLAERADLDATAAEERVAELVADGLLVEDGPELRQQRTWLRHGWRRSLYFHRDTGDWAPTEWDPDGHSPDRPDSGRSDPDAALAESDVALPEPGGLPDRPLDEVLLDRRTCREFDGTPMDYRDLSVLLDAGLRPVREARARGSAGPGLAYQETAAFPFSVRPVVARSPNLDPGTYRYLVGEHALRPVDADAGTTPDEVDAAIRESVVDQPFVDGGAVTLLVTADLAAYRRLRRDPGALRHLFTAVSAHVHRLILAATALGFDCFQSAAFDDDRVSSVAGTDPVAEPVLYLLTVGTEVER